jgi:hypothetical protein
MEKEIKVGKIEGRKFLTDEEKNIIKAYQKMIDKEKMLLANLRIQYITSENRVIQDLEKAQNDFYSHIKILSKSKNIPANQEWFFDPAELCFKPKP